jgi:hypothetical protein
VQQQFASVDLLAIDSAGEAGDFADNVNVIATAGASLPSEDDAKAQYDSLGFTPSGTESLSTDVGDGYVISYDGELGGFAFTGRGIAVETDEGLVNITISAGDADAVLEQVTSTLQAG